MSIKTNLAVGAFGTALFAAGVHAPVQAQVNPETDAVGANSNAANFLDLQPHAWQPSTTASADGWTLPENTHQWETQPITQASALMDAVEQEATRQALPAFDSLTLDGQEFDRQEFKAIALIGTSQAGPSQTDLLQADDSEAIAYPNSPEIELAQRRRRRTRTSNPTQNFIGVAADFSYFDDVTFGVISKLSLRDQISIRPSVLIGDGHFAALVPVTYEFNQYTTDVSGFQVSPYAGVGIAYNSFDDALGENESTVDMLLSAGADVPISEKFTLNAQLNYTGLFGDFDGFGITVGVGYNLGNLFR